MKMIKVTWLDAHGDGGRWMEAAEIIPDAEPCETVGFVASETDDFICLMQTHGFDGQYYNHLCVPKGMIIETTEYEE